MLSIPCWARRSARLSGLAGHGLLALGCSDEATVIAAPQPAITPLLPADAGGTGGAPSGTGGSGASEPGTAPPASEYVVSSLIFGVDGTTGYISLLDSLEPQTIDYTRAREFAGAADVWVHGGAVFVTSDESFTITKFAVEDGALVEQGVLSFASYGLSSFGFWLNTFVAADKAYLSNDTLEYIVWDPESMRITGTLALPDLAPVDGFRPFGSYSDRAAVLRDGLLYQPFYYTDESFFLYAPESRIVVIDVATDTVVDTLDAPCPGLDYATADEDGNLYFSSWVYAAGGAAVLDQPATCVFEVPATGEPRVAFSFADVTDGRHGAAMRYIGGGKALLSVLHDERFAPSDTPSAADLTFADNWRFWSYDLTNGTATLMDAIDWNAGAQYSFAIDGRTYMLVAAADYSATTVYDLGDGQALAAAFDTQGWATRLFKVR